MTDPKTLVAQAAQALIETIDNNNVGENVHNKVRQLRECLTSLADSPNWLQERLKAERERCAKVCLVTTVSTGLGDKCAAAIRALPEGE